MSLLLLFKDYWHQTRGAPAGPDVSGWIPPAEVVPEKPKKKIVKKRRRIRITPEVSVQADRFTPEEWYAILWLLQVRIQELEGGLSDRLAKLKAEAEAQALDAEIAQRIEILAAEHALAIEQLARIGRLMLAEEEEFLLFMMMQ